MHSNLKLTSITGPMTGFVAAFETRMSTLPNVSSVWKKNFNINSEIYFHQKSSTIMCTTIITWLIRRFRSSSLATWQTIPTASIFNLFNSPKDFCTFCSLRLEMTTCAPSSPRRLAIANPILQNNWKQLTCSHLIDS